MIHDDEWQRVCEVQLDGGTALFGIATREISRVVDARVQLGGVFLGLSLLAEGWREVYRATKADRLATNGLYAVVRHPQYTGIFPAIFGQLIHWPTIPTLILFPVIIWAYYRLAKREEQRMLATFGAHYAVYRQQVPMFLPKSGD